MHVFGTIEVSAPCRNDPLLEIAMELERVATHDQYFVQRGLYPNVDFYSGIVLRALGVGCSDIPACMFRWPRYSWIALSRPAHTQQTDCVSAG